MAAPEPAPVRPAEPLAVFFDEQAFLMQSAGGISRYVCALAHELAATGEVTALVFGGICANEHLAALAARPGLSTRFIQRRDRLRINSLVAGLSRQWRRAVFRRFRRRFGRVIYHPSYYEVDPAIAARADATVVTFHDMIPEWLAGTNPQSEPGSLPVVKFDAARQASLILADSESTRRDVMKIYPELKPDPVVIHLASHLAPPAPDAAPPAELAGRGYFLLVGNRAGYKNGEAAFQAFAEIAPARPGIVLAGFGGEPLRPAESDLLRRHNLLDRWIHLRGNDELLARCYQHAIALVYPSRYEGFGLPVLEAMQSGCPVVTTRCASLPEVGGDAVLYVEPDDVRRLGGIMSSLLEDAEQRRQLTQLGRDRAKMFSWQATAKNTLVAYRQTLSRGSPALLAPSPPPGEREG